MLSIICCEVVTPVALFTRAWIEIDYIHNKYTRQNVALFTRAWIEISTLTFSVQYFNVALFTRAWIEIYR